jgi:hypothetical protein
VTGDFAKYRQCADDAAGKADDIDVVSALRGSRLKRLRECFALAAESCAGATTPLRKNH